MGKRMMTLTDEEWLALYAPEPRTIDWNHLLIVLSFLSVVLTALLAG